MTALDNRSPWAVALLGVADARGEPALCVAIQAVCGLGDGRPLPQQPDIDLAGAWHGEPASSSPREAPCSPMPKAGVDCLLRGLAHAREVRFRCGPVGQAARVRGRRTWRRGWLGIRPSPEEAFEPVPLRWEEALGPQPANPVGTGLADAWRDGIALPRLEAIGGGSLRWGRAQAPVGFGPTAPAWLHRRDLDPFTAAAHCAAPPGLVAEALRGDEAVAVRGGARPIDARLPGLPPPSVRIVRRCGDLRPDARLDTVLVDADAATVRLTWRSWCLVGGHELVETVEVA